LCNLKYDQSDFATILWKTIIEQDLLERIKGKVNHYVEKDLGIQISNAYHLQAKSIKQQSPTIELQATEGISLKCGGNVLTVDSSGVYFKTANLDTKSGNGGIVAPVVDKLQVQIKQSAQALDFSI